MTRIRSDSIGASVRSNATTPRVRTDARFVGGPGLVLDASLNPTALANSDADHSPVLFSVGHGKDRVDVLSWNVCFR